MWGAEIVLRIRVEEDVWIRRYFTILSEDVSHCALIKGKNESMLISIIAHNMIHEEDETHRAVEIKVVGRNKVKDE